MDETRIHKTPTDTHTTIRKTETAPARSGGAVWFMLGGVIAVLGFVIYFMFGDGSTSSTPSASDGGNVSVNVESNSPPQADSAPAPSADPAPTTEPAPSAEPTEPAPVETAPQGD